VLIEPGYIVTGIGKAAAELSKPSWKRAGRTLRSMREFFISVDAARTRSKTTPEDCARVMLHAIETRRAQAALWSHVALPFHEWSKWLLTDSAMDGLLRRRFGVTREN